MDPLVNIAVEAARAAGAFIVRNRDKVERLEIQRKGVSDFVTEIDKGAEALIINTIRKYYPEHAFICEEHGNLGSNDWTWIIDPLDGTTNYLHRWEHYSVSIAVMCKGELQHAVIYQPATDDQWNASKGKGAFMNRRRIRVSSIKNMREALIGTGVPIGRPQAMEKYSEQFTYVANNTAGIRRAGSAALDLAYVASGRLDGFWEMDLKQWDIAAGVLLVQEAGGIVQEMQGNDVLKTGNICAANAKLFNSFRELLDGKEPLDD